MSPFFSEPEKHSVNHSVISGPSFGSFSLTHAGAGGGAPASLLVDPLLLPPDEDPVATEPLLLPLPLDAPPELVDDSLPSFIPTIGAAGFPSCETGSKSS